MKALCWHSPKDIRRDEIPDPKIEHPRDAIIKVTSCAICGSDLHLYDGYMPGMENGDVMGHEFMGEVSCRAVQICAPSVKYLGAWIDSGVLPPTFELGLPHRASQRRA